MHKVIIIIIFLLSISISFSETIIVDPNGFANFKHIQEAINNSTDGDTIIVRPGTYYENVYFFGMAVKLTSTNPNDPSIVAQTIIDGNNLDSVITFAWGEDSNSIVSGFTITNGKAQYGGGVCCWETSPTIKNCIIIYNNANFAGDTFGGGLYGSWGTIQNCNISNNSAGTRGGGLCECNGTIIDCDIKNNSAVDYSGDGGGLSYCDADIINCSISGNSAGGYNRGGGGLYNCDGNIIHCEITYNTTEYGDGGGLSYCDGTITDSNVIGNSAPRGCAGALYKCNGDIINCLISFNSTSGVGGGFRDCGGLIQDCIIKNNTSDGGGGLYNCDGPIKNCIIALNSTTEYSGGGLYNCDGTISNCIIENNESFLSGGGLYNCNGIVNNCTIINNYARENGAGIYFEEGYSPAIKNNIIASNRGTGVYWKYSIPNEFSYNNVWGNTESDYAGWAIAGEGDISVDPCFVSLGFWSDPCNTPSDTNDDVWNDGDYHLKSKMGRWNNTIQIWIFDNATSYCIDAGDANSDWTEELWPHGNCINMGAYGGTPESSMSLSNNGNIADLNLNDTVDLADMVAFVEKWMCNEYLLREDLDRNGIVDFRDFAIFAYNWQ